ncbi:MAG: hypothetical protein R3195_00975 [Gemmatimonadota bacterium]|nr:hypothetical protein [Gemmatimonadota bacterium]
MSIRRFARVLPLPVLAFVLAGPVAAQDELEAGMWTGTVIDPNGEVFDLQYDVSYVDDALVIDLIPPPEAGMSTVPTSEPMVDGGTLVFTFDIGQSISCALQHQDDGSYEGECLDSTGGAAIMTMMPPVDGGD